MLAQRRALRLNGEEVERTPLLVPSFSSKGFPDAQKILKTTEEVIEGPILLSAYDLYYKKISNGYDFPSLIFLDSGGYEASKDTELSDLGERDHAPSPWTQDMHEKILAKWKPSVPSVIISYDHPSQRLPFGDQIRRAKEMAVGKVGVMREILLKPELPTQSLLKIDSILDHIHDLAPFDVIGVTEKEVGNSILNRMENIARLRKALNSCGLGSKPIHVFGSLDTITTPAYFVAGADIFDGLTWLRFAFHQGYTMYKHNFGALELGVKTRAHMIDGRTWFHNYRYLADLELEMRRFLNGHDFGAFRFHSELFSNAYQSMAEAVGA